MTSQSSARSGRWPLVAAVALLAAGVSGWRARTSAADDRNSGLQRALSAEGLEVDGEGILWLEQPPLSLWRAASGVPVVVRARTGPGEPHDIFLAQARLSPEGVLLSVGRPHNLTETSAVDELRPVGHGTRFAFAERPVLVDEPPSTVRLFDLAGPPAELRAPWSRMQRAQEALTRLQETGSLSGVDRVAYRLEPAPTELALSVSREVLRIEADDRVVDVPMDRPAEVPIWLGFERQPQTAPGNLVTWAVDRVRHEVGDEAMQYVKAIAFSALDVVLSSTEEIRGDTGAEQIADDLGEASLEAASRAVPVDPDIGFPPPPVSPWVTPPLPGEGEWQGKEDDGFMRSLPGLPPTFVTTFIRSDRNRKATRVYIALWDPRLVQLNMMAGVAEPKSATGATGPGLIPREPSVLRRTVAAMNAGFQALHGEFGMMSDGVVYLPPKPYAATVTLMRDGSAGFGTWPEDATIPDDMLSYRQNMTALVVDGEFNPYKRTWWGGTPADWEDKTHTVRTGICLTEERFVGYFYGADLSPNALARAMIQARCSYGLALDMNAGHSGLEFYRVAPADELPALDRPLDRSWEREGDVHDMAGWRFRARRLIRGMGLMNFPRYIRREGRDFFYLTLRHVLPGSPLPVEGAQDGDGHWQVKGLPQHGFPYALALTEVPLAGRRVRVLRMDPRMVSARGDDDAPVVAELMPAGQPEADRLSVWFSPTAFALASAPPIAGAVRLASDSGAASGVAALGVEDDAGMLLYVEAADPAEGPIPATELRGLLARSGSSGAVVLSEPLALALGGDTDMSLRGVRLTAEGERVVLYRRRAAGGKRVFEGTPVVPFDTWYPLQARRIRYFKKPKDP